jgi:hypothetical protein
MPRFLAGPPPPGTPFAGPQLSFVSLAWCLAPGPGCAGRRACSVVSRSRSRDIHCCVHRSARCGANEETGNGECNETNAVVTDVACVAGKWWEPLWTVHDQALCIFHILWAPLKDFELNSISRLSFCLPSNHQHPHEEPNDARRVRNE